MNIEELKKTAARVRGKVVELSHRAKTPHLGSSLSCVDILVAAYWEVLRIDPARPADPNRDRFILSKGHAATTLYTVLAYRGFFPEDKLKEYNVEGCSLQEHPGPICAPGVEAATGSLGHGICIGLGMALAARIQKQDYRVLAVLSDGECNEGSVWEAALFGAANKLSNMTIVVDYNKWQATGRSNEVLGLAPLRDKWSTFGWEAHEVDGHDLAVLAELMSRPPNPDGRPRAIVANTVKGKGVSFMEDDNNWHYKTPNEDELHRALVELGLI
ncbi:MAG TPA: transketolase [Verrucomicrobia bacterium]|nr:MAG: transketolase [Lentisphaerae bacterium GWF2_57_35]HBA84530.1 transketolase [Verrucomicrobiota bacterium]